MNSFIFKVKLLFRINFLLLYFDLIKDTGWVLSIHEKFKTLLDSSNALTSSSKSTHAITSAEPI